MKNTSVPRPGMGVNTQLTHIGNSPVESAGFVNPPVVRGSTVLFPDAETLVSGAQRFTYGTDGTPTTEALCTLIDSLEGSAGTVLVPTGLAAVAIPFLSVLAAGDHALIVDSVYFPTRRFCDQVLTRFGVSVDYYPADIGEDLKDLIKHNTRLIHAEVPGSNTFEMQDIAQVSAIAHAHGCVASVDNTWATPLFFKPLEHGADISIHAATKYPSGHSDVLMGFVSANAQTLPTLQQTYKNFGMSVSSDDAYQVLRGMRTMGVRLDHHQRSAMAIATWLEAHEQVAAVLYPALPSFPHHALWKRDFSGASGLMSFVLKEAPTETSFPAHAFLNALELIGLGFSWGGYESLAVPVSLKDRMDASSAAPQSIIRLHVGLEDPADIIADLERGFRALMMTGSSNKP